MINKANEEAEKMSLKLMRNFIILWKIEKKCRTEN